MEDVRIADRVALQELKAKYYRYVDTKQWDAWRELLADDIVFYKNEGFLSPVVEPMAVGADDLVEKVSANMENAVSIHQLHMPELQFTGENTATGIWALYDWVERFNGTGFQGFGHLHENYVKGDDGRWRVSEIHLTRLRLDSSPSIAIMERTHVSPWRRPTPS
jgi:hypothetical protein